MSILLNASTSTGLGITSDNSGSIEVQSNGTTKLTVSSTGVSINGSLSINGNPPNSFIAATAQSTTSGLFKDFTGIPSWAKRITVIFNNVSNVSGTNLLIQIGSGSIENTGYSAGGGYSSGTATQATSSTAGFFILFRTHTTTFSGNMIINLISGSTYICSYSGFDVGGGNFFMSGGGSKTTTAIIDRVRIITSNGTDPFDAGSINIFYEG